MVDFNSEATVTTPDWQVLKILALEKRENLILSVEFYWKNKYTDAETGQEIPIIKARLWCLYYELEGWLNRAYSKKKTGAKDLVELKKKFESNNIHTLLEAVTALNSFMDEQGLTRIDTKQVYDKNRVEVENAKHQL